jgi:hypothetical protein
LAKRRLDRLALYPRPVEIGRVRLVVAPWFFRIPGFRRYHGYALWRTILVRRPDPSDDLVTHELCHIWQMQHRPLHVLWTWATTRYRARPADAGGTSITARLRKPNPYEREARRAVADTR